MFNWNFAHIQKLKMCTYVLSSMIGLNFTSTYFRVSESFPKNLKWNSSILKIAMICYQKFFDGLGQDEKRAFKKILAFHKRKWKRWKSEVFRVIFSKDSEIWFLTSS